MIDKFVKYAICLTISYSFIAATQAQWSIGIHTVVANPMGEYARNLNSPPVGLSTQWFL